MLFPKISIITPSFNQGQFIEQTILSVLNQNYPDLEYIIMDGGSTDNTLEIIKKYADHLKYWISEKDKGQADAINKGLIHCTGDIFNWINSDDYLAPGALQKIANKFKEDVDMVAGAVQNFDETGNKELYANRLLSIHDMLNVADQYIYHQPGVWMKMEIMHAIGKFDASYHYCFDQEYMLRYLLKSKKVGYIPDVLAYFRLHYNSKTVSQSEKFKMDFNRMYKEFWHQSKGTPLELIAKAKSRNYEWPLLHHSINNGSSGRFITFFKAMNVIFTDPKNRFNKRSIGWLKHIMIGKREG